MHSPISKNQDFHIEKALALYEKVKNLIEASSPLDENTARLIIESADDAIKEFGSTHQDRKVDLKKWKTQAELVLPPETMEDLKKRAAGHLLKKAYPRNVRLRNLVLISVAVAMILMSLGPSAIRQLTSDTLDNNESGTAKHHPPKVSLIGHSGNQFMITNTGEATITDVEVIAYPHPLRDNTLQTASAFSKKVGQLSAGSNVWVMPGDLKNAVGVALSESEGVVGAVLISGKVDEQPYKIVYTVDLGQWTASEAKWSIVTETLATASPSPAVNRQSLSVPQRKRANKLSNTTRDPALDVLEGKRQPSRSAP